MLKITVDQAEVKDALRACVKPYTISKKLGIPLSVVNDIKAGKDRLFFFRRSIKNKEKYCTCCGLRKKMPGARYLCYVCFAKHSGEVGIDEHRIIT